MRRSRKMPRGASTAANLDRNHSRSPQARSHFCVICARCSLCARGPRLPSPGWVWFTRRVDKARMQRSALILVRSVLRTRVAKKGLREQPWAKPSACVKAAKAPSGSRCQRVLSFAHRISKRGMRGRNLSVLSQTEQRALRDEMALNAFIASSMSRAQVGDDGFNWHSRSAIVESMTKSTLLGILIPSLSS